MRIWAWTDKAAPVAIALALAGATGCEEAAKALDAIADVGLADVEDDAAPTDVGDDPAADAGREVGVDVTDADASNDPPDATDPNAFRIRFDLTGEDFFATPWPSDHRVHEDGTPDLSNFPGANVGPMPTFRAAIEGVITGFSTMPVGYFAFEEDIGDVSLPDPATTLRRGSVVQLIDVSETGCGTRIPLIVEFDAVGDPYRPANVLSASPVPGFVLDPLTPYAFVVRREFGLDIGRSVATPAALADALAGGGDATLAASLAPLVDCLADDTLDVQDIGAAAVFTTQDPTSELQRVRDHVVDPEQVASPEISELAIDDALTAEDVATTWRGTYRTPIYQSGVSPYNSGGAFAFEEDGTPSVQRWEDVPFILSVPDTGRRGPFPVLVFIDGTGASLSRTLLRHPAKGALERGFAVAAFAPQFHDSRAVPGSDPIVHGFNYINPVSGRTVFRQQVVDTAYFVRVLREALDDQSAPGSLVDLETLVYGGHSQGGIVGAFVAGVESEFDAYVLNGTGTYLSITITRRVDPIDIPALIEELFAIGRPMDVHHPLAALVQLGTDVVEPHNYARYWAGREGHEGGAHMLVVNGWNDTTTFPPSMDAMAISGALDPVAPAGWDVDPYDVWDPPSEVAPPIVGNREAVDGSPLTFATFIDRDGDHFTIRKNERILESALRFWEEAIDGVPSVH